MKIFITGASGFIGTYVVQRLARTSHEMCCLVRETSHTRALEELGVPLVIGDVTDRDSLREGMRGADWVIHLANIYTGWEPDIRVYTEVNVEGTRKVMACALELGVSKVVHVSTVGVFGKPEESPFREDTPVGPVLFSEYARSKYQGDLVAWELYKKKGLPLVVVYPAGVLGAGDDKSTGEYMTRLIEGQMPAVILTDSICTYVHVRDVAEGIVRAVEKEGNIGEKYILAAERFSIKKFNKMFCETAGVPLPRINLPDWMTLMNAALLTRIADLVKKPPLMGLSVDFLRTIKASFLADGSKASRELGFQYTPVRTAVEDWVKWYRAEKDFFHWTGPTRRGVDIGPTKVNLPIMYYRDDAFLGFFSAAYEPVRALLPSSEMHPVRLPNGRATLGVAAFNYLETSLGPYGEIAVFIPCTLGRRGPPLLPLLREGRYPGFGSFILHLPVTSLLAREGGRMIYGFPKFVADMDFERRTTHQRVRLSEGGDHILTLTVQGGGRTQIDNRSFITYSVLDGELLKTTIPSRAIYQSGLGGGLGTLALGDHEIADQLKALDISPTAFATRNYLAHSGILPDGEVVGPAERPYIGYTGQDREFGRLTVNYDYAKEPLDIYARLATTIPWREDASEDRQIWRERAGQEEGEEYAHEIS